MNKNGACMYEFEFDRKLSIGEGLMPLYRYFSIKKMMPIASFISQECNDMLNLPWNVLGCSDQFNFQR